MILIRGLIIARYERPTYGCAITSTKSMAATWLMSATFWARRTNRPKATDTVTEEQLAQNVAAWFQDQHWDTFYEVQLERRSRRADIVARRGSILAVVETKTNLSVGVIGQAQYWIPYAHFVYVAVPDHESAARSRTLRIRPKGHNHPLLLHLCRDFGIGILRIAGPNVQEELKPRLNRKPNSRLARYLVPEHQTFAQPGNASCSYWSPFKRTCETLRHIVKDKPGCTLKEAVDTMKDQHHYSSPATAISSLRHWLDEGKVDGIRMERIERRLRLFPDEVMK